MLQQNSYSWQTLLNTVIPTADFQDCVFESDQEHILITGGHESIQSMKFQLEQALANPHLLIQAQSYSLERTDHIDSREDYSSVENEPLDLSRPEQNALDWLNGFLGERFYIDDYFHLTWSDFFKLSDDNDVFISKGSVDKNVSPWQGYLDQLITNLAKKTLRDYIGSFLENDEMNSDGFLQLAYYDKQIDRQILETVMGIVEIDGSQHVYFDFNLLKNLIFPPKLTTKTHADETTLCLSVRELTAYFRQVFDTGLVLQEQEHGLTPILLPSPVSPLAKNIIYLILDVSGSMLSYQEEYAQEVIKLLNKLKDKLPNSAEVEIRLVPFSDKKDLVIEPLELSDFQDTINNRLQCNGGTKIKGTFAELYKNPQFQANMAQGDNVTFILFTDGDDLHSTDKEKAITDAQKEKLAQLPQIFVLGYAQYEEALCKELATSTGGQFFPLKDLDFSVLEGHFNEVTSKRELVELVLQLKELTKTYFHAVYQQPVITDHLLQDGDRFIVNGKEYTVRQNEDIFDLQSIANPEPTNGYTYLSFFSDKLKGFNRYLQQPREHFSEQRLEHMKNSGKC